MLAVPSITRRLTQRTDAGLKPVSFQVSPDYGVEPCLKHPVYVGEKGSTLRLADGQHQVIRV